MKRHLRWAARLYPRVWRERYGDEFEALLEDVRPGWRDAIDILLGALKVHLTTGRSFWKLAAATVAAGLLIGAAAAWKAPKRWVSTGVVRVESAPGAEDQFRQVVTNVLSRGSLAEIVQRPALDLYKEERGRLPMEDVIEEMRNKHIRIAPGEDGTVTISFAYPDQVKADRTVRALMNRVATAAETGSRQHAAFWLKAWPNDPPPPGQKVALVAEPGTPQPVSDAPAPAYLGIGGAAGLLAGWLLWRPRRHLQLAAFAALGAVAVAAISFTIPDRFESRAVVRITPPHAPKRLWTVVAPEPPADQFRRLQERVFRPEALAALGAKPENLRIAPAGAEAFAIQYADGDRMKAQKVVRELIVALTEQHIRESRARAATADPEVKAAFDYMIRPNLEVLDPASLPERPVFPNRLAIAGLGLPAGLFAGVWFQRRRRPAAQAA